MLLKTKKGLLKQKPLPINSVYKNKHTNSNDYTVIICKYTNSNIVKDLLFKFVNSLPFVIKASSFEKQLKLLENITEDEQIKIINLTLTKKWKSLSFAYEHLIKKESSNENK